MELIAYDLEITISHPQTSGLTIKNYTIASTTFNDMLISCKKEIDRDAVQGLTSKLNQQGCNPRWIKLIDQTNPEDIQEFTAEEYVEETEETVEEAGEHEHAVFGLVAEIPGLDKSGWLTPISDPLAYKRVFLAAWKLATGFDIYQFTDLTSDSSNIRSSVAAVMMSGIAGESIGVPARAVNPWSLGTNGEQEMLWIRVIPKMPDPTTKPFRAGMGPAREAHMKTLSGLPVHPDSVEASIRMREKKEQRVYAGVRGLKTVGANEERAKRWGHARAAGEAARSAAFNVGYGFEVAELHYMEIFCATLRYLGDVPYAPFERKLMEAGVDEGRILGVVDQMRSQKYGRVA